MLTPNDRAERAAPGWSGVLHGRANRAWFQSIAGKLLLAFGLIVALTVGATWLSLIRFNQVDSVMHRLTDGSLPAVKIALGVESTAKDVIATATDVGQAESEAVRSQRMDALSDQMSHLWARLGDLRAIVGDNATASQLWEAVSSIDSVVYVLNQTTADAMRSADRRHQSIAALAAATRK